MFPEKSYNLYEEIRSQKSNIFLKQNGEKIDYERACINPVNMEDLKTSMKKTLNKNMNRFEVSIAELLNEEPSMGKILDNYKAFWRKDAELQLMCQYNLDFYFSEPVTIQSVANSSPKQDQNQPIYKVSRDSIAHEDTRAGTDHGPEINPAVKLLRAESIERKPFVDREETKNRDPSVSDKESSEYTSRLYKTEFKHRTDSKFLKDVSTAEIGFLKVILSHNLHRLTQTTRNDTCTQLNSVARTSPKHILIINA